MIGQFLLQPFSKILSYFSSSFFYFNFMSPHSIISFFIFYFPSANYPHFFLHKTFTSFLLSLLPFHCLFSSLSPFFLFPHCHIVPLSHLPPIACVPPCLIPRLSIRSWRSVSATITMWSCSLSERLIVRASRPSSISQSKSCKHSALSSRTRAKPCLVRVTHTYTKTHTLSTTFFTDAQIQVFFVNVHWFYKFLFSLKWKDGGLLIFIRTFVYLNMKCGYKSDFQVLPLINDIILFYHTCLWLVLTSV